MMTNEIHKLIADTCARVVSSGCNASDAARDCAQAVAEAFLLKGILEDWKPDGGASLKTWVVTVAKREAVSYLRREGVCYRAGGRSLNAPAPGGDEEDKEAEIDCLPGSDMGAESLMVAAAIEVEDEEAKVALLAAIAALPEVDRDLLTLPAEEWMSKYHPGLDAHKRVKGGGAVRKHRLLAKLREQLAG